MRKTCTRVLMTVVVTLGIASGQVLAAEKPAASAKPAGPACDIAGPQTPRDIDSKAGSNKVAFETAPKYQDLNLCNIHFHAQAEHKAADYAIPASNGVGYQCAMSKKLSAAELKAPAGDVCKGLKPGDTIEVHWVHSSCDVKPGKGLGSCVNEACKSPKLRVEAQVFTLVNDPKALNWGSMLETGKPVNGKHQAMAIPANTGTPVQFPGSTTGPSYDDKTCSDFKVTWSVRPQCAKLDINSVAAWCKAGNVFGEDHPHGVRKLVTNPSHLAPIAK
jgi:Delta carbonic anhydrase